MAAADRLVKRPGFFVDEGFPRGPACDPVLLRLSEDQRRKLQALSGKTGAPVSALIRKAIEAYLKQKRAGK